MNTLLLGVPVFPPHYRHIPETLKIPTKPLPNEECNFTLDPGAGKTFGIHLGGTGLWIVVGAGLDAYLMFDAQDVSNYVIIGTIKSGLGLGVDVSIISELLQGSLNLDEVISAVAKAGPSSSFLVSLTVSESTLDELRGTGAGAELNMILLGVSTDVTLEPIGSVNCSNASADFSIANAALGANLHLNVTDIIYDSRRPDTLFPYTFTYQRGIGQ